MPSFYLQKDGTSKYLQKDGTSRYLRENTVTQVNLTPSTANTTSYASTSFTPPAGELLAVVVHGSGSVATDTTLTASANGITFAKVGTDMVHTLSGNVTPVFVANQLTPSSPASMTVTWDCTTDAATGAFIEVVSVSGISKTGTAAILQTAFNPNIAANGAYAATFSTATTSTNLLWGFVANNVGGLVITQPSPWNELTEPADQATPGAGLEVAWISGQTGTVYTWTASAATVRANVGAIEFDMSVASTPNTGSASGTWTFVGAAAGVRTPKGSGTGTWTFVGTAAGTKTPKGSSTGTWTFAGASVGYKLPKGSSTGTWTFSGAAVGDAPPNHGSATGTWTFSGAAAGVRTPKGTGTGTWTFAGASVGYKLPKGSATGTWTFSGAAAGKRTPKASSTGTWTFSGASVGYKLPKASATGSWSFAGSATGVTVHSGTASGTWTFSGAAAGVAPTGTPSEGSATGTWTFAGAAAGKKFQVGASTGTWTFTGASAGTRTPKATATGTWTFTGAASGNRTPKATATGTWAWVGVATGKRSPKATGAGTWTWVGSPLAQVHNLVVTPVSGSQINLSWDSVSGAAFYEIERDGSLLNTSRTTGYSDTGLSTGTTYTYRVRAGG